MKKTKGSLLYPLIMMGLVLIFSYGCKKDSNGNNEIQQSGSTVTDIDGNVYPVVTIGTQTWMAANLKTTRYRNGDAIPLVSDSVQWTLLKTPGYCNFDNKPANAADYGFYYNFYAVTDSRSIAPQGWHVPSQGEWVKLINQLGSGGGGKLKETGQTHWSSPNTGANNQTGFNGRGGGDRSYTGEFHYLGTYGCFWCSTENSATEANEHVLSTNSANILTLSISKDLGMSVRCVKDTI